MHPTLPLWRGLNRTRLARRRRKGLGRSSVGTPPRRWTPFFGPRERVYLL